MENLNKRPSKGILRFSEGSSRSNSVEKDIKWDETNIKETLHPDDKDYGHMKIDEPPTPYTRSPHGNNDDESDDDETHLKTDDLLDKVSKKIKEPPVPIENIASLLDEKDLMAIDQSGPSSSIHGAKSSEISYEFSTTPTASSSTTTPRVDKPGLTEFELHRKRHYNEYDAVKLAKKLIQKELEDEDDEEEYSDGGDDDRIEQNACPSDISKGKKLKNNNQTHDFSNEDVLFE